MSRKEPFPTEYFSTGSFCPSYRQSSRFIAWCSFSRWLVCGCTTAVRPSNVGWKLLLCAFSASNACFTRGEPLSKHAEPLSKHAEPLSKHGEPLSKHGKPLSKHGEPLSKHSEPLSKHGEPLSKHGEPLSKQVRGVALSRKPPKLRSWRCTQPRAVKATTGVVVVGQTSSIPRAAAIV